MFSRDYAQLPRLMTCFLEELPHFPSSVLFYLPPLAPGFLNCDRQEDTQPSLGRQALWACGRALTREERPLVSPLALLLTTLDGVTSSSVGDLVRGGTMPTAGRHSGQWVPQSGTQGCPLLRGARPRPFTGRLGPAPSRGGSAPPLLGEVRPAPSQRGWVPPAAEVEAQVRKRFLGCE